MSAEAAGKLNRIQDEMYEARQAIEEQLSNFNELVKKAEKVAEEAGGHLDLHSSYKMYAHNTILSQLSKDHGYGGFNETLHCIENQVNEAAKEIRHMEDED